MKTFREEFLTQHMSKQEIAQYAEASVTTVSSWLSKHHDKIQADMLIGNKRKMYKKEDVVEFIKWKRKIK